MLGVTVCIAEFSWLKTGGFRTAMSGQLNAPAMPENCPLLEFQFAEELSFKCGCFVVLRLDFTEQGHNPQSFPVPSGRI